MANVFGTIANETLGTDVSNALYRSSSGNDIIDAGGGDDVLVYRLSSPDAGGLDIYRGGTGWDTLELRFTAGEWSAHQGTVNTFFTALGNQNRDPLTGNLLSTGSFGSINFGGGKILNISSVENLRVLVDNVETTLEFAPKVMAAQTAGTVREDQTFVTTGSINFLDLNLPNTHTAVATQLTGSNYGTLTTTFNNSAEGDGVGVVRWNYLLNNLASQKLGEGQSEVLTFNVRIQDNTGRFVNQGVAITVIGKNDAPAVTTVDLIGGVTEGSAVLQDTGFVRFQDVDLIDTHTPTTVVRQLGALGTLTTSITTTATGGNVGNLAWTYSVAESDINYLAQGQTKIETFVVGVKDGTGASVTRTVSVTITGTNDAPDITVGVGNSAAEAVTETNAGLSTAGTLTVTDLDTSNTVSSAVTGVVLSGVTGGLLPANVQGMLAVNTAALAADAPAGSALAWTFNSGPEAFDFLAAGESLVLTYTVTATDTSSATDTQTVTVTVNGTNDAPDITVGVGNSAAEAVTESNAGLSTAGTLTVTDLDTSNTVSSAVTGVVLSGVMGGLSAASVQGMLTVDTTALAADAPAGSALAWTFSSGPEAFDFLAAGESLVLTYTVTATDTSSETDTQTVTVTVNGTNDAPDITVGVGNSAAEAVTESNAGLSTAGTLTVTDLDTSNTVSSAVTGVVLSGVMGGLSAASVQGMLTVDTTALAADAPAGSALTWTFNSGPEAFNFLAAGESLVLTYTVTATDTSSETDTQTVTVTVNGTNDAPDITVGVGNSAAEAVTESNAGLSTAGTLTVTDLDTSNTVSSAVTGVVLSGVMGGLSAASVQGMLTVDTTALAADAPAGSALAWTFSSGPEAFDFLAAGESLVLTYTVTATDTSSETDTQTVTVTVNGTNDAPDITVGVGNSAAEAVTESNAGLSTAGTLTVTDLDTSNTVSSAVTGVVLSGVMGGLSAASVQGMLTVDTTALAADAPAGSALTWTFNSGPEAFNFLAAGESLVLTYTVTATDTSSETDTQTVTVTVNGTNDAPDITVGVGNSAAEAVTESNAGLSTAGTLTVTDLDTSNTVSSAVTGVVLSGVMGGLSAASVQGMLTVDTTALAADAPAGSALAWTFSSGPEAFDFLAAGESLVLTYTVTATDTSSETDTQTVKITVNGTNDAPIIISAAQTGAVVENAEATLSGTDTTTAAGTIAFTDVDLTDLHTASVVFDPTPGQTALGSLTLTGTSTGTTNVPAGGELPTTTGGSLGWNYVLNAGLADELRQGETITEAYTVTVLDEEGWAATQTITITITGTNDVPTIGGTNVTGAAPEANAAMHAGGTLTVNDVDRGETAALEAETGNAPTATLTTGPALSAAAQDAYDTLVANLGDLFSATVDDNGTLTWSFDVPPVDPQTVRVDTASFDFLAPGHTLVIEYQVRVRDESSSSTWQTITITVTGTNDAPSVQFSTPAALTLVAEAEVTEDQPADGDPPFLQVSGLFATDDPDGGTAPLTFSSSGPSVLQPPSDSAVDEDFDLQALLDEAELIADQGGWTFTLPNNGEVQKLGATKVVVVYQITASDGSSSSQPLTLTITINGDNDDATITGELASDLGGTVVEAGGVDNVILGLPTVIAGDLDSVDPDGPDQLFIADSGPTASGRGFYDVDEAGTWHYSLNNENGAVQALQAGGPTLTDTFTVQAADGTPQTITVYITGTNDSPVVSTVAGQDAGSVVESGDLSAIAEAGLGGPLEPTLALGAAVNAALLASGLPSDQAAMQALINDLMTSQSIDKPTAIAAFWDSFDDQYSYGNTPINTAFVLLGVEYASYVKAGGSPLLDVTAKYTADGVDSGTAPDRLQSMHDNLLGNLAMSSLSDRGLDSLSGLVSAVDPDLLTRAVYSGNETDGGLAAARAWDMANGFAPTASGTLSSTDVDAGHTATWTGDATSAYGTFAITAGGVWTYTLNNASSATQALKQGEVHTETFTATVTDDKGATATEEVTITITGRNDAPVVTTEPGQNLGTVVEAGNLDNGTVVPGSDVTGGTLSSTDVDATPTATWTGDATGTYGTFAIDAGGAWTYTLDNGLANSLAEGTTATETFTATVSDRPVGSSATDTFATTAQQTVTVTITGTNDSPVVSTVAGQDAGSVVESGDLSAIAEAGLGGPLEPTLALGAAVNAALLASGLPSDQAAMQALINDLMTSQSIDKPTAIAAFWDSFDDQYSYGNTPINTAFVLLGVEYASYVKAGGSPLLDVTAKYTADGVDSGTAPDRLQSMHDNLLGNLAMSSLSDRGLDSLSGLVSAVDPDLLTRAVYSGNETDGGLAAARAWDMANGFAPTASGTLSSTDVDAGHTATWTGDATSAYGTFAITAGGVWTYTLNNASSATQALKQGEVHTETFTATVTDDKGATATEEVTITITGRNDAPVVTTEPGQNLGTVVEAGNLDNGTVVPGSDVTGGTLSSTDVDATPTATWTGDATGTYGTFAIDAGGAWTYTLDNGLANSLAEGTTATETFTATVTDDFGGTAQQTVSVTITGTNDTPKLTGTQAVLAAGTEDQQNYTVTKAALLQGYTDVDDATLDVDGLSADHGSVVLNVDGVSYTITPDADYHGVVMLTYDVVDSKLGVVSAMQSFVVQSVPDVDTVTVNATLSDAAQKPGTDDLLVGSGNSAAQFSVATDAADAPGLEIGLKAKERFTGLVQLDMAGTYTVRSGDQTQSPQNFSLSTFDDAWARWGIDVSIGTATTVGATATLASYDYKIEIIDNATSTTLQTVDLDGDTVAAYPAPPTPGAVVFNGGTVFQNTLNIAQFLTGFDPRAMGDYQIRLTAYEDETTTAVLSNSINVKVENNEPVALGNTISTDEDTAITITAASLLGNDSDVDGQALSVVSVQGAVGGTVNMTGGDITFTPNLNFNGPASFTYTISDGQLPPKTSTATVTVNVAAVNDPATITSSESEDTTVVEAGGLANGTDANPTASGQLTVSDVDAGQAKFQTPGNLAGDYGNFTFDPDTGVWGYSLNNGATNVQGLNTGDTVTDQLTVTSLDNTASQIITVTITGANDAAVLSADVRALNETDTALSTSGTLTITDVDSTEEFVAQTNAAGDYGLFSINTAGAWTYTATSAHDDFLPGTVYTDSFEVQAVDGTTTTVTVNITGTNDDPELLVTQTPLADSVEDTTTYSVTEASLLQGFSDVDGGTLAVSNLQVDHGSFAPLSGGSYAYTAEPNYHGPVTLTYNVVDQQGGSVSAMQSFVVQSVPDVDTVTVNATLSDAAQKPGTDDLLVGSGNSAAQFSVATDAADAPGLEIGLKAKERFTGLVQLDMAGTYTVRSGDQTQSPQNFSLSTFDDAWARWGIDVSIGTATTVGATATLASYDYKIEIIDNATSTTLQTVDLDGDTVAAYPAPPTPGAVVFNGGTVFQNTLNIAQFLTSFNPRATGDYQIRLTAYEDETTTAVLSNSINVKVENNEPVALGNTISTDEDTAITITAASLLGNDSDVDGQALSVVSVQGAVGGTVNMTGGDITFTPNLNFNGPASFTYTISDGQTPPATSTATVTVNVAPINDAPTAGNLAVNVSEDGSLTALALPGNDVDAGTTLTYTQVGVAPVGLTFNPNGTFSFDASANSAYATLNVGQTATATFNYTASDGALTSNTGTVTITVQGANDAASISGNASGSVTEAGGVNNAVGGTPTDTGTLFASDDDNAANVFQAQSNVATAHGSFSITAGGTWTYTLNDTTDPLVAALNVSQTLGDSFTVKSQDGTEQLVSITINGTNDAPALTAAATVDMATGAISFTAVDPDNAALTMLVGGVSQGAAANGTTTTLALPEQATVAAYSGNLVVSDGSLEVDTGILVFVGDSGSNTFSAATSTGSVVLAGHGGNDVLTGGTGNDYIDGGLSGTDTLDGLAGNDTLIGGGANDVLKGGLGNDALYGGDQSDTFIFTDATIGAANADQIFDFVSGVDYLQLSGGALNALFNNVGSLKSGVLVNGTIAPDTNAHLLYDNSTGELFFDADGSNGGAAQLIATLVGSPPALLLSSSFLPG